MTTARRLPGLGSSVRSVSGGTEGADPGICSMVAPTSSTGLTEIEDNIESLADPIERK